MDAKKIIKLISVVAALLGGGVGYEVLNGEAPAEVESKPKAERKRCVFASFRDGQWVTGWGTVKKILPDDTVPPCHQRFLLVDPAGETLLIANKIDRWPRLADLHAGDIVEFKGEFKDGERGYLVHWTHPDTSGRRPGGYVRKAR